MSFSSSSSPLQPFQEFPTSATSQEPSHSSSPNGSYSQVLIVLAIIVVVSIVGCVVGRIFCKDGESKAQKHGGSKKKGKQGKGNHGFQTKDVDIEFGFGNKLKPMPSAKIAAGDGFNTGFPLPAGGGWNGEVKGMMKGSAGRVPGQMEFKTGPGGPIAYNPGQMGFKNGPGGPIPYNPGQMGFKNGPGPMPYN